MPRTLVSVERIVRSKSTVLTPRPPSLLVLLLPLGVRHAVNGFARLFVAQVDTAFERGRTVPLGQAVAAEAREVHHVDVLHVRALAKMLEQAPERRSFDFGSRPVVHRRSRIARWATIDRAALARAARAWRAPAASAGSPRARARC